jgi:hypothetical protein
MFVQLRLIKMQIAQTIMDKKFGSFTIITRFGNYKIVIVLKKNLCIFQQKETQPDGLLSLPLFALFL